jgi:ABC-2 type transport system permease protein
LIRLIENEVLKMLSKKKLVLISVILLVLVSLFCYGENAVYKHTIMRFSGTPGQTQNYNWKSMVNQQILYLKNTMNSQYIKEDRKNSINIQIEQLQYYINHNINPITPTSAKFTIDFMDEAIYLFLPLLIIILAGDAVSGEFSSKTIKVLLTRAVPRWKILLSKYIGVLILSCIVILESALMCVIISSFAFHNGGWNEPMATGFKVIGDKLDSSNVIRIYQWQYAILVYSLGWFVSVNIATLSFMVSVIVRNTVTSVAIMLATLIGGGFLQMFLQDWPLIKYFFAVNLDLTQYLTASYQPVSGMSLSFSASVLCLWSIAALVISFSVFQKQDVLV